MLTKKKFLLLFPTLLLIEMILGFTGSMIVIGGIGIRYILIILSFFSLYLYAIICLVKRKTKFFSFSSKSYFGGYTVVDWMALIFFCSMILWSTVIPFIMGTNLHYSRMEILDSLATFSLFFPVRLLIKYKEIDIDSIFVICKYAIVLLAVTHIIFYFGQESSGNFVENVFEKMGYLLSGNSRPPQIILGHGYTRIFFATSVYFLLGLYIFYRNLSKLRWYDFIIFSIDVLAILVTFTKSVWYGVAISLALLFILVLIFYIKNDKKIIVKTLISVLLVLVITVISDIVLLNGMISIRLDNSFNTTSVSDITKTSLSEMLDGEDLEDWENSQVLQELDQEGAYISNNIKLTQIKYLFDKWKKSPIIGFGYGSYAEEYTRSEEAPFSYEVQSFALLMKLGIVGVLIWVVFFIILFISLVKQRKTVKSDMYMISWLFLFVAFFICIQTNPLLISFTGMSIVVLLALLSVSDSDNHLSRTNKEMNL